MQRETLRRVMEIVLRDYPAENWSVGMDPFEVLISVIISQNTTVANERRALENLREGVGLSPEAIASADTETLEAALRPAGLFRLKAPRLKQIARYLLDHHEGDLRKLLDLPPSMAREALMALPGVGPKTADVALNVIAGLPNMPVDTHIWRVARRWEITTGRSYEDVRGALEELIEAGRRREAHLSLIRFGRTTCTARRPLCPTCPVQAHCPYYGKLNRGV